MIFIEFHNFPQGLKVHPHKDVETCMNFTHILERGNITWKRRELVICQLQSVKLLKIWQDPLCNTLQDIKLGITGSSAQKLLLHARGPKTQFTVRQVIGASVQQALLISSNC